MNSPVCVFLLFSLSGVKFLSFVHTQPIASTPFKREYIGPGRYFARKNKFYCIF